jgi:hypothetical protein
LDIPTFMRRGVALSGWGKAGGAKNNLSFDFLSSYTYD